MNSAISIFLPIAIALFAGLMLTRLFKVMGLKLPDVTCYLIAGLIIGPYGIGRLGVPGIGFTSLAEVEEVGLISEAALGFIAFSIGSEFRMSELKHTGRATVVIGILQAATATLLVDIALIGLHFILGDEILPLSVAITMGAIAAATAPAATLMVVRQYKASGPLTSLLLPIVALDDAVGLVIFSVSFGIALAVQGGEINVFSVGIDPMIEIVASILLGGLLGYILAQLEKLFHSNRNRLSLTISFVFLTIAISHLEIPVGPVTISFSSLLICMMLGTVFCNVAEFSKDIMDRADKWTVPLNCCFFVLSGAELELGVFSHPEYVLIGVVYIIVRSLGKYFGARESSRAVGCDHKVVQYLGVTLLPQAGVALGMCAQAGALGEVDGGIVRNITLFGVLIYELLGPTMTKIALTKADEITPAPVEGRKRFAPQQQGTH